MRSVIIRFLSLNPVNDHWGAYVGLGGIWLVLLVANFLSLRGQPISLRAKLAWFAVILLLPILGMTFYAFWCLAKGDWSFLKPIFSKPTPVRQYGRHK